MTEAKEELLKRARQLARRAEAAGRDERLADGQLYLDLAVVVSDLVVALEGEGEREVQVTPKSLFDIHCEVCQTPHSQYGK